MEIYEAELFNFYYGFYGYDGYDVSLLYCWKAPELFANVSSSLFQETSHLPSLSHYALKFGYTILSSWDEYFH